VIESFKRCFGQRAEEAIATQFADYTVLDELEAVRCPHAFLRGVLNILHLK
jgi:hypothetical protein